MGLTLTTITPGATTSASALRTYVNTIETYINEGIVSADLLATAWVERTHVFGPSFFGSPNPRARFETGQVNYRHTSHDRLRRTIHHHQVNTGQYVAIDGLCDTYCLPETLRQGSSPYYRLRVEAAFYCFEYGGTGGAVDESTDLAAHFKMFVDEAQRPSSERQLYTGSGAALGPGVIYARHNHHMSETIDDPTYNAAGIHHVAVKVNVESTANLWQHIFVAGRDLRVSWWLR